MIAVGWGSSNKSWLGRRGYITIYIYIYVNGEIGGGGGCIYTFHNFLPPNFHNFVTPNFHFPLVKGKI